MIWIITTIILYGVCALVFMLFYDLDFRRIDHLLLGAIWPISMWILK